MGRLLTLIFIAVLPLQAGAFSVQKGPLPLGTSKHGSLTWELFNTTRENEVEKKFDDGSYTFVVTPEFTKELRAHDGKQVKIYGYMFPLEQGNRHSNFLFGPYPPSCPFHYHTTPTMVVEVKTQKPLMFYWQPIVLQGTLRLTNQDPNGVYYYLEDAALFTGN